MKLLHTEPDNLYVLQAHYAHGWLRLRFGDRKLGGVTPLLTSASSVLDLSEAHTAAARRAFAMRLRQGQVRSKPA
jgi:hypothetical protein